MYKYIRRAALKDLEAQGSNSVLKFTTPNEVALVKLSEDGMISSVTHTDRLNNRTFEINPNKVKHVIVGKDNNRRDVYHYLGPSTEDHLQLRLGLTVHSGQGTWSSLPHDFENTLEPDFEEVFFYTLTGGSCRALQLGRGVWMDGMQVDDAWPVVSHSFSTVPMGYHPVVGEPNVHVKYVWAYIAKYKRWEKI